MAAAADMGSYFGVDMCLAEAVVDNMEAVAEADILDNFAVGDKLAEQHPSLMCMLAVVDIPDIRDILAVDTFAASTSFSPASIALFLASFAFRKFGLDTLLLCLLGYDNVRKK